MAFILALLALCFTGHPGLAVILFFISALEL